MDRRINFKPASQPASQPVRRRQAGAGRQAGRQADRQANRQADRQANRQADRQAGSSQTGTSDTYTWAALDDCDQLGVGARDSFHRNNTGSAGVRLMSVRFTTAEHYEC